MCFYRQPEHELTEQEKLLAALIDMNHRIPAGLQIGMPRHLDSSIATVDKLFTEHKLQQREELIAEDGLRFAHQCDHLMRMVIQTVDKADKRT